MKPYVRQSDLARLKSVVPLWEPKPVRIRRDRQRRYIFYKIVTMKRGSRWAPNAGHTDETYADGAEVTARVNRDPYEDCAAGLHVLVGRPRKRRDSATPEMLIRVAVEENDIGVVPVYGARLFGCPKLRVRRLTVIGRASWKPRRGYL